MVLFILKILTFPPGNEWGWDSNMEDIQLGNISKRGGGETYLLFYIVLNIEVEHLITSFYWKNDLP